MGMKQAKSHQAKAQANHHKRGQAKHNFNPDTSQAWQLSTLHSFNNNWSIWGQPTMQGAHWSCVKDPEAVKIWDKIKKLIKCSSKYNSLK